MPSIDDYRAKFPSLRDLPDEQLITRVAEVDNVSREDVMAHMGYNPSDAGRGLKESFQQLPQLGWGAVAGLGAAGEAAFGEGGIMSAVKNRGIKGYTEWSDKIESKSRESDSFNYSWEQAKEGDFGALIDWLQHGLGYVTGQGIQALATAGIGAIGGKMVLSEAAKTVAKGMVIKDATRIAEQQVAKEAADQGLALTGEQIAAQAAARAAAPETIKAATANVASKIGQTVGLGGMAIGQEGGEIFGDLTSRAQEEGRQLTGDDLAKAFGATLMAGGLEFVGDKLGLDIVMGKTGLTKMAGGIQGVGGKVARGAIAGAAAIPAEAGTEYFQTGLEEYGKGTEQNMLPFNQSETAQAGAFDAAMLGGLGGGAIGAAGGLMSKARAKAVDQQASNTLSTTNDVGQMVAAAETLAMAPLEWNGRYEPEGGFQSKDPLYVFPDGSAATRDETVNVLAANAAQDNLEQWFARSPAPMERDKAETLAEMAGEKTGKPMSTVPLPDGSGWTVVPTAWVDSPAVAGYIEQATAANAIEQEKRARIEIAASAPVDRAPRTVQQENTGPAKDMTDADLVKATVDQFRRTNTPQARAFVGQYDAGRITNDDVLGLLGRPPKSPDQRIAEAAAQAPTIQPGDLLTADGFPYGSKSAATVRAIKEGGKVIEVPGGYAVRKREADGQPRGDEGTGTAERGAVSGDRSVVQQPADQRGSAGNAAPAVGGAEPGDGAAVVRPGEAGPAAELTGGGFIPAPNGYKVRVSRHQRGSNVLDPKADIGAFVYEVRKGDGDLNPLTMVVNKDGKFVEAGTVLTGNTSNGQAWVPKSQAAADAVQSLLEQRAGTKVGSDERKAIDAKIAEAVAADQAGPPGDKGSPELTADTDLPTLKKAWSEATAAGDTERAREINDRIVALKKASVEPREATTATNKSTREAAARSVYQATERPGYESQVALSLDDADFEIEALQSQQERGKLRPDSLARSEFGQRLDAGAIMSLNESMKADPAGTLQAIRDSIAAKKGKATPKAAQVESDSTPSASSTDQAPVKQPEVAPAKQPEADDDYIAKLFGTPEQQAAAQAKFEADTQAKTRDMAGIRDAIAEQKKRAVAEHDDWAGRVYKGNKTQVDLRGDGPSRQDSMSIGAINESRRRKAMEALAQELKALDKLAEAVATDSGTDRVLSNLRDLMGKAERAVASGNWPGSTVDGMFESMLLDDLKFSGPGGKGNVTSNGLSKAVLAAIKPGNVAAPAAPIKGSKKAAEIKAKRPPKSFRAKQMVTTTVLVEETGKFEKREIDAETAMVALDADINELEAFLKCLQKG